MADSYVVAAAQTAPAFMDLPASVRRAEEAIAEAASGGARFVVFPETWLRGCRSWADVGIPWEGAASKAAFASLHRNAVEVPGSATEALCRAARRHRVLLVMGMTERDARGARGAPRPLRDAREGGGGARGWVAGSPRAPSPGESELRVRGPLLRRVRGP